MSFIFPAPEPTSLPINGTDQRFPVRRVFCVGRNFVEHAKEMGGEVDREAPFYFMKDALHVALAAGTVPVAPRTENYHHEVELIAALGSGGTDIRPEDALGHVFGYGVGLDMTRRDLQAKSKAKGRPWDTAKNVEWGCLSSALEPISAATRHDSGLLELRVNGEVRQSADMGDHVWSLPEIIADLSGLYALGAGDLIMMGTPAGVGPVVAGDRLQGSAENIGRFDLTFVSAKADVNNPDLS